MQPSHWRPSVELAEQETHSVKRMKKAKLFVFLRKHRHERFDEAFQQELASLYRETERGHPPMAPAMLALALILEAYTGVSDDEVIEATVMDRRWHWCWIVWTHKSHHSSLGTLVAFRQRLIEGQMDRRLIERTIEIASQSQGFGPRADRAALDSSPWWGASRVEDTYHLVGHARRPGHARGGRSSLGGSWSRWPKKRERRWSAEAVLKRRWTAIGISTGRKMRLWAWS